MPNDIWDMVIEEITNQNKKEVLEIAKKLHNQLEQLIGNFEDAFPELSDIRQMIKFLQGEIIVAEKRLKEAEELVEEDITGIKKELTVKIKDKYGDVTVVLPKTGSELCSCEDFKSTNERCKHIYAVLISLLTNYWKEDGVTEMEE